VSQSNSSPTGVKLTRLRRGGKRREKWQLASCKGRFQVQSPLQLMGIVRPSKEQRHALGQMLYWMSILLCARTVE